jgi:hypothetical protein
MRVMGAPTRRKETNDMQRTLLALLCLHAGCVDPVDDSTATAERQSGAGLDDDDRNPAAFPAPGNPYRPDFDPTEMDTHIDMPMNPLPVGATWRFRAITDEGTEIIDVTVLPGTRAIGGTRGRIIHDVARLNGVLREDTLDWFAQDDDDNVWYLGEATSFYDNGTVSHAGSWETGKNGAKPGVQMLADPRIGDKYRQEFRKGHAEDYAIVIGFNKTVTVPAGTFHGCMQTRDKSTLDLTLDERKTYCPGIGLVLIEEGDIREELISYSGL